MTKQISRSEAEQRVSKALRNAQLDEVRFSNARVLLRFLSGHVIPGQLVCADLEFCCPADFIEPASRPEDFVADRSRFLGRLVTVMGLEIQAAQIGERGELTIALSSSLFRLENTGEPYSTDDLFWDLRIEDAERHQAHVSCVFADDAMQYFVSRSSPQ
jgi:hypothetical protein